MLMLISMGEQRINLSNSCNNNCIDCSDNKNNEHISFEAIKNKLDQIKEFENELIICGGEPSIRKDIFKIINYAKSKKKEIVLQTNGRIFSNEQFTKKMKECGVDVVIVKVNHYLSDKDELISKSNKSFQQTVEGINNLKKYLFQVRLELGINIHNVDEIKEIFNFYSNLIEINEFIIKFPTIENSILENIDIIPTIEFTSTKIKEFINEIPNSTEVSIINIPLCHLEGFEKYVKLNFSKSQLNILKKNDECSNCKYDYICNGIDKKYLEFFPKSSFNPIPGKKISESMINLKNKLDNLSVKRVELNIGFACNNNCQFCVSGQNHNISLDSPETIISEIKKYKNQNVDLLNILGGEPTLLKKLPEIVKASKEVGFKNIHTITNGRNLKDYDYTFNLLKNGLSRISITIHGHNSESHDDVVERKGAFDETIQGIKNVVLAKRKLDKNIKLTTGTCITKKNYKNLLEMAKMLYELGTDELLLINLNPMGNCDIYYDEIVPDYEDIKPHLKETAEFCSGVGLHIAFSDFAHCIIHEFANKLDEDFQQEDEVNSKTAPNQDFNGGGRNTFDWMEVRNSMKIKVEACKTCIYNSRCEGIWKNYIMKYGKKDFKPVIKINSDKQN